MNIMRTGRDPMAMNMSHYMFLSLIFRMKFPEINSQSPSPHGDNQSGNTPVIDEKKKILM
jgi:hypothetical protein